MSTLVSPLIPVETFSDDDHAFLTDPGPSEQQLHDDAEHNTPLLHCPVCEERKSGRFHEGMCLGCWRSYSKTRAIFDKLDNYKGQKGPRVYRIVDAE